MEKEEARQPLHPTSLSDTMSDHEYEPLAVTRSKKKSYMYLLVGLVILLVSSNIIWLWAYSRQEAIVEVVKEPYYNSSAMRLQPFHWITPFNNKDKAESDKLWAGIFPHEAGDGLVSVPKFWAASQNLPYSKNPEYAEDDSHGLYLIAVLHQLHCLTVIRSSLYHLRDGTDTVKPWSHITHCLDSIRQSLMCSMDSTLMYTDDGVSYGDGQVHQCKDWDALMNWSTDNHMDISRAHPPNIG
ncbi:hypothetical protein MMC17_003044 [Xylographa soralifera]|nr:hypothetical protein [Xylographa soralifera]